MLRRPRFGRLTCFPGLAGSAQVRGAARLALENGELLAQGQVLEDEAVPPEEQGADEQGEQAGPGHGPGG